MKKYLFSFLLAVFSQLALAENILIVYLQDGSIKAFMEHEVDSIVYSKMGVDGTYYESMVTQEVWTTDSVYRIPIASVDSLGHVVHSLYIPPAESERGSEETTDDFSYTMSEKTIFMRSDVSDDLLSYNNKTGVITFAYSDKIKALDINEGDILYSTERTDLFPNGYCLRVTKAAASSPRRTQRRMVDDAGFGITLNVFTEKASITDAFTHYDGAMAGAGNIATIDPSHITVSGGGEYVDAALSDYLMSGTNFWSQFYQDTDLDYNLELNLDKMLGDAKKKIPEVDFDDDGFTIKTGRYLSKKKDGSSSEGERTREWEFSYKYDNNMMSIKWTTEIGGSKGPKFCTDFSFYADYAEKTTGFWGQEKGVVWRDETDGRIDAFCDIENEFSFKAWIEYGAGQAMSDMERKDIQNFLLGKKSIRLTYPLPNPLLPNCIANPVVECQLEFKLTAKGEFAVEFSSGKRVWEVLYVDDPNSGKDVSWVKKHELNHPSADEPYKLIVNGDVTGGVEFAVDLGVAVEIPWLLYGDDHQVSYFGGYVQRKIEGSVEAEGGYDILHGYGGMQMQMSGAASTNIVAKGYLGIGNLFKLEVDKTWTIDPQEINIDPWTISFNGFSELINVMPANEQCVEVGQDVTLQWTDNTKGYFDKYDVYVGTTDNRSEMQCIATIVDDESPRFVTYCHYAPQTAGMYYWYVKGTSDDHELYSAVTSFQAGEPNYVDLGLPSGTVWSACNIGASKPEGYGSLYAWGERETKKVFSWGTYKHSEGTNKQLKKYTTSPWYAYNHQPDGLSVLQADDDVATVLLGSNWKIPSKADFQELFANCTVKMGKRNGVSGLILTSNMAGYGNKELFLPAVGHMVGDENEWKGQLGRYWTSTLNIDYPDEAYYCEFAERIPVKTDSRYIGMAIRPVMSSPAIRIEDMHFTDRLLKMRPNTTATVRVEYIPSNTNQKTLDWTSSNDAVATVNANGVVRAEGTGACFITGKSTINGELTDRCTVIVSEGDFPSNSIIATPFPTIDLGLVVVGRERVQPIGISNISGEDKTVTIQLTNNTACFSNTQIECWIPAYYTRPIYLTYAPVSAGVTTTDVLVCEGGNTEPYKIVTITGEGIDHGPTTGYVDLGLPSGTLWAQCNLGASTPEEIGSYYAWGEVEPYGSKKNLFNWTNYKYCKGTSTTLTKYCPNSNYGYQGYYDQLLTLQNEDDAAFMKKGGYWRMPTNEQWNELIEKCSWSFQGDKAIVRGPNGNIIALPLGGNQEGSNLYDKGADGYYWSSTVDDVAPDNAWYLYISKGGTPKDYDYSRCHGRCIRPVYVKDEPQFPYLAPQRRSPKESSLQSGHTPVTKRIDDGGVVMTIGHVADAVTK